MNLISPEEIEALPDDPRAAFIELEWTVRERIDNLLAQENYSDEHLARERYVALISEAAGQYGIAGLPEIDFDNYKDEHFWDVRRAAVRIATRLTFEAKQARATEMIALPDATKARLRKHLSDLEAALKASDLPEKKRKALEAKLKQFASELDKGKSSVGIILAAVAAFAAVMKGVGYAEDNVIKLPATINAIVVLIGHEKIEAEERAPPPLPRPAERRSLPAPAEKRSVGGFDGGARPSGFADDLDDDVPF